MSAPILVLNCGSSSIKYALFEVRGREVADAAWRGQARDLGAASACLEEQGRDPAPLEPAGAPHEAALARIMERVDDRLGGRPLRAVAHRVVHGGSRYSDPVLIDAQVLHDLRSYTPLAPLHQPFALQAIGILLGQRRLPQVACFDTAFHHDMPLVEQLLPLPRALCAGGLRRYGFHGLSYEYLSHALPRRHGGLARGRVIAAHLGSGASLCAMRDLRSIATTMGFSALDGIMMGTRSGALDPGALLYLMQVEKLDVDQVARMLYHESGLLGVSGISGDPRVLLRLEENAGDQAQAAHIALALYIHRLTRELGAFVAVLGGLDLLVFTAGIGEHNAAIRLRICRAMAWLGVEVDEAANASHAPVISTPTSRVTVAVEPTNEEWIAARHAAALTAEDS